MTEPGRQGTPSQQITSPAFKEREVDSRSHCAVRPQTFIHHLHHARHSRLWALAGTQRTKVPARTASGLPWGDKQDEAGNARCVERWDAKDKAKAGGEGSPGSQGVQRTHRATGVKEAGRASREECSGRGRGSSSEVGRGSPVSLRHNRRPLSSEQSELGETAAKERPERQPPHPTGHAYRTRARLISGGHAKTVPARAP